MNKGAIISECKRYRYQLWRIWDESKPLVLFIMHNPSTADENEDDPTIRRCIGFAKSWGYGGIMVGNMCAYRCTDPKELKKVEFEDLWSLENIEHICEMINKCELHVLAHGNPIVECSIPFIDNWHYLKLTKAGNPCHPLYLKSDLKPQKINSNQLV
jgi:hypothetical protein